MKLSIVTTLYQSESFINEFYERARITAAQLVEDDYEIIFVNDGSPDNSLGAVIKLTEEDTHVVVVDLSRNFGHHKAMMTGLAHTKGEKVFLIDCDLEEEPEWLKIFSAKMAVDECDVVYGIQERRKGDWFERYSGKIFWSLINQLTGLSMPANIVTARLMTRRYIDSLLMHEEREVFIAGLWHITGFVQKSVSVLKLSRGKSTYTLSRKLTLLTNSVTSFSALPLAAIFYIGLIIFFLACGLAIYLTVNALFFSRPLAGWTSVMVSVWLLGGLILSGMGIIGIYLSKVFSETKARPYTIVRALYGG